MSRWPSGELRALTIAKATSRPVKIGTEASNAYLRLRELTEKADVVQRGVVDAFVYNPGFGFRDSNTKILGELYNSLIGGNVLILLMLLLFLSPFLAAVTFFTVLFSQSLTIASIHLWGISVLDGSELNIVTL